MQKKEVRNDTRSGEGARRVLPVLLWLAVLTGWLVSIFSVIEEMCLASACSDAASFTIFGFNMGFFGIAYFSLILLLVWLRKKVELAGWALTAAVFAGIGSEFRLLWIQKNIIGSWCPLCVTICCALFVAATLLTVEKVQEPGRKNFVGWLSLSLIMSAAGLAIATVGVKALT